jgi:4-hydroxythreonine-4-phosphate dehydrogenase
MTYGDIAMPQLPRVGLLLGDPCGIGPELVAKLLGGEDLDRDAQTVVIGEPRVLARGGEIAGVAVDVAPVDRLNANDGVDDGPGPVLLRGPEIDPAEAPIGEATAAAGGYVLDTFRQALGLAKAGELDAICFAPCNKQAMHLGGLVFEDELSSSSMCLDTKAMSARSTRPASSRRRASPRMCRCAPWPT